MLIALVVGMTYLMNQEREGAAMALTFTLPKGTRAGIVPTQGLGNLPVEQLGLEWLAQAKNISVVFYVPNEQALNRVGTGFGLREC